MSHTPAVHGGAPGVPGTPQQPAGWERSSLLDLSPLTPGTAAGASLHRSRGRGERAPRGGSAEPTPPRLNTLTGQHSSVTTHPPAHAAASTPAQAAFSLLSLVSTSQDAAARSTASGSHSLQHGQRAPDAGDGCAASDLTAGSLSYSQHHTTAQFSEVGMGPGLGGAGRGDGHHTHPHPHPHAATSTQITTTALEHERPHRIQRGCVGLGADDASHERRARSTTVSPDPAIHPAATTRGHPRGGKRRSRSGDSGAAGGGAAAAAEHQNAVAAEIALKTWQASRGAPPPPPTVSQWRSGASRSTSPTGPLHTAQWRGVGGRAQRRRTPSVSTRSPSPPAVAVAATASAKTPRSRSAFSPVPQHGGGPRGRTGGGSLANPPQPRGVHAGCGEDPAAAHPIAHRSGSPVTYDDVLRREGRRMLEEERLLRRTRDPHRATQELARQREAVRQRYSRLSLQTKASKERARGRKAASVGHQLRTFTRAVAPEAPPPPLAVKRQPQSPPSTRAATAPAPTSQQRRCASSPRGDAKNNCSAGAALTTAERLRGIHASVSHLTSATEASEESILTSQRWASGLTGTTRSRGSRHEASAVSADASGASRSGREAGISQSPSSAGRRRVHSGSGSGTPRKSHEAAPRPPSPHQLRDLSPNTTHVASSSPGTTPILQPTTTAVAPPAAVPTTTPPVAGAPPVSRGRSATPEDMEDKENLPPHLHRRRQHDDRDIDENAGGVGGEIQAAATGEVDLFGAATTHGHTYAPLDFHPDADEAAAYALRGSGRGGRRDRDHDRDLPRDSFGQRIPLAKPGPQGRYKRLTQQQPQHHRHATGSWEHVDDNDDDDADVVAHAAGGAFDGGSQGPGAAPLAAASPDPDAGDPGNSATGASSGRASAPPLLTVSPILDASAQENHSGLSLAGPTALQLLAEQSFISAGSAGGVGGGGSGAEGEPPRTLLHELSSELHTLQQAFDLGLPGAARDAGTPAGAGAQLRAHYEVEIQLHAGAVLVGDAGVSDVTARGASASAAAAAPATPPRAAMEGRPLDTWPSPQPEPGQKRALADHGRVVPLRDLCQRNTPQAAAVTKQKRGSGSGGHDTGHATLRVRDAPADPSAGHPMAAIAASLRPCEGEEVEAAGPQAGVRGVGGDQDTMEPKQDHQSTTANSPAHDATVSTDSRETSLACAGEERVYEAASFDAIMQNLHLGDLVKAGSEHTREGGGEGGAGVPPDDTEGLKHSGGSARSQQQHEAGANIVEVDASYLSAADRSPPPPGRYPEQGADADADADADAESTGAVRPAAVPSAHARPPRSPTSPAARSQSSATSASAVTPRQRLLLSGRSASASASASGVRSPTEGVPATPLQDIAAQLRGGGGPQAHPDPVMAGAIQQMVQQQQQQQQEDDPTTTTPTPERRRSRRRSCTPTEDARAGSTSPARVSALSMELSTVDDATPPPAGPFTPGGAGPTPGSASRVSLHSASRRVTPIYPLPRSPTPEAVELSEATGRPVTPMFPGGTAGGADANMSSEHHRRPSLHGVARAVTPVLPDAGGADAHTPLLEGNARAPTPHFPPAAPTLREDMAGWVSPLYPAGGVDTEGGGADDDMDKDDDNGPTPPRLAGGRLSTVSLRSVAGCVTPMYPTGVQGEGEEGDDVDSRRGLVSAACSPMPPSPEGSDAALSDGLPGVVLHEASGQVSPLLMASAPPAQAPPLRHAGGGTGSPLLLAAAGKPLPASPSTPVGTPRTPMRRASFAPRSTASTAHAGSGQHGRTRGERLGSVAAEVNFDIGGGGGEESPRVSPTHLGVATPPWIRPIAGGGVECGTSTSPVLPPARPTLVGAAGSITPMLPASTLTFTPPEGPAVELFAEQRAVTPRILEPPATKPVMVDRAMSPAGGPAEATHERGCSPLPPTPVALHGVARTTTPVLPERGAPGVSRSCSPLPEVHPQLYGVAVAAAPALLGMPVPPVDRAVSPMPATPAVTLHADTRCPTPLLLDAACTTPMRFDAATDPKPATPLALTGRTATTEPMLPACAFDKATGMTPSPGVVERGCSPLAVEPPEAAAAASPEPALWARESRLVTPAAAPVRVRTASAGVMTTPPARAPPGVHRACSPAVPEPVVLEAVPARPVTPMRPPAPGVERGASPIVHPTCARGSSPIVHARCTRGSSPVVVTPVGPVRQQDAAAGGDGDGDGGVDLPVFADALVGTSPTSTEGGGEGGSPATAELHALLAAVERRKVRVIDAESERDEAEAEAEAAEGTTTRIRSAARPVPQRPDLSSALDLTTPVTTTRRRSAPRPCNVPPFVSGQAAASSRSPGGIPMPIRRPHPATSSAASSVGGPTEGVWANRDSNEVHRAAVSRHAERATKRTAPRALPTLHLEHDVADWFAGRVQAATAAVLYARCFRRLRLWIARKRHLRLKKTGVRVMRRTQQRRLARCFAMWRALCTAKERQVEREQLADRIGMLFILRRMQRRASARHNESVVCATFAARVDRRTRRQYFAAWKASVWERERLAVHVHAADALAKTFAWRRVQHAVRARRDEAMRVCDVQSRVCDRLVCTAFSRWRGLLRNKNRKRRTSQRARPRGLPASTASAATAATAPLCGAAAAVTGEADQVSSAASSRRSTPRQLFTAPEFKPRTAGEPVAVRSLFQAQAQAPPPPPQQQQQGAAYCGGLSGTTLELSGTVLPADASVSLGGRVSEETSLFVGGGTHRPRSPGKAAPGTSPPSARDRSMVAAELDVRGGAAAAPPVVLETLQRVETLLSASHTHGAVGGLAAQQRINTELCVKLERLESLVTTNRLEHTRDLAAVKDLRRTADALLNEYAATRGSQADAQARVVERLVQIERVLVAQQVALAAQPRRTTSRRRGQRRGADGAASSPSNSDATGTTAVETAVHVRPASAPRRSPRNISTLMPPQALAAVAAADAATAVAAAKQQQQDVARALFPATSSPSTAGAAKARALAKPAAGVAVDVRCAEEHGDISGATARPKSPRTELYEYLKRETRGAALRVPKIEKPAEVLKMMEKFAATL